MAEKEPVFHSDIWNEEAEPNNPFEAKSCHCHGYDVYGDLLGKASWIEYLFLMFKGERPSASQAQLLEHLAVAFANRGPRDNSVRAAMNGGVGGSVAAGSLMAALAVGAGQYGGAHEVYIAVNLWKQCGKDIDTWKEGIGAVLADEEVDIWLPMEHAPGFEPNGLTCPTPVLKTLNLLSQYSDGGVLSWLQKNRGELEAFTGIPLAMTGVAAAALFDLGFTAQQAEMLFLLFRLPGAAVHALEQQKLGWKKFPFYGNSIHLTDDPGFKGMPKIKGINI
ncbi:hypothetical protein [Alkalimarinus coralli]|uniref:hypothetical protein n=1 Tax=Alkalimarinus coralli TaxID=2935863 RepID=UPI00202B69AD|nr:hypothetical protein [Alkalimarinus coralli]